MITEDRKILNERFVQVFGILEKRRQIIRNDRKGKGMGDFAKKILGKPYSHIIRAFLNPKDKRCIDYHQSKILCEKYGVSEAFMFQGEGEPFPLIIANRKKDNKEQTTENQGNIGYFNFPLAASPGIDAGYQAKLPDYFFSLPGLSGRNLVAFPVEGNSMEPLINDGDVVVCQPLEKLNQIKDNAVYAVLNQDSFCVKHVKPLWGTIKDNQHIYALKLISANYLDHEPFIEDITERTKLYKVVRRISAFA